MKKVHAIFVTFAIILGLVLLFIMVNQAVDRISHHEDVWAREFTDLPSIKLSTGD